MSHDVYFMNSICKEIWLVKGGQVTQYPHTIDRYKKDVLKDFKRAKAK